MPNSSQLWEVFPFPTIRDGVTTDGSIVPMHPDCVSCPTRDCVKDERTMPGHCAVCRYGLLYAPVDERRRVVGMVGSNLPNPSPKARQRFQNERDRHIRVEAVQRAVEIVRNVAPGLIDDLNVQRQLAIESMKSDPALLAAVGNVLRKDLEDNLSQSHDFLQLVKAIRGHAEVLLLRKHPSLSPEEAAEQEPTEGSIYFATTLMASKVDSLVFLNEVNRAFGDLQHFQIHPLILKYVRIYEWQAKQKSLRLDVIGSCFAICYYNPDAIVALIQGFLDNMVKYAPARSKGTIRIEERDDEVRVEFSSLGPEITQDEAGKIFLTRFRGSAARDLEPTGQGVGLGVVKELSDALDLNAQVSQEASPKNGYPGYFDTTFSFRLSKIGSVHDGVR